MRVLICGGRSFDDPEYLNFELDRIHQERKFNMVIHGAAIGADRQAGEWAAWNNIKVRWFAADWKAYGKAAGPIRNARMIADGKPELVIAFPGGKGTRDMIDKAEAAGIEVIRIPDRATEE